MTVLVQDLFNGTNGTDIDAHAPDIDVVGSGWLDTGANTVELDGSGALKFSGSNKNCVIDTGATDQIVTTNFNAGGSDNRSTVGLRANGLLNSTVETYYNFNFRTDDSTNSLQIYKTVSGSTTLLASSGDLGLSNSTTYELECRAVGSSLEFYIDGALELSVTDTSITSGDYAGLEHQKYVNGNARFNDFLVEDTGGLTIIPVSIPSGESFGTPTITTGVVLILPVAIPTQESVGSPTIVTELFISPVTIPSEESVGDPVIELILQQIFPDGIPTEEFVGRPTVLGGDDIIIPVLSRQTWNAVAQYLRDLVFRGQDNDVIMAWFRSEGLEDGAYNDLWYEYLLQKGFIDGSLTDKYAAWRQGDASSDPWLLSSGSWNDYKIWRDTETWKDS
jgi:hypothetical protein